MAKGLHRAQLPGLVPSLGADLQDALAVVLGHHKTEANPKIERVPEIGFGDVAGGLEPIKHCWPQPAPGVHSGSGSGG